MTARRFPDPGWAWPLEPRDLLLKAALLPQPEAALDHFARWLGAQDLDDAGFADHRLLAAITERHGAALGRFAEYPRLKGLQRTLWTESRMRVPANLPILRALAEGGVSVQLFKGAARVAVTPAAQRQRAHQDVDVLVRPDPGLGGVRSHPARPPHGAAGPHRPELSGAGNRIAPAPGPDRPAGCRAKVRLACELWRPAAGPPAKAHGPPASAHTSTADSDRSRRARRPDSPRDWRSCSCKTPPAPRPRRWFRAA